jgi:hypothetical protein
MLNTMGEMQARLDTGTTFEGANFKVPELKAYIYAHTCDKSSWRKGGKDMLKADLTTLATSIFANGQPTRLSKGDMPVDYADFIGKTGIFTTTEPTTPPDPAESAIENAPSGIRAQLDDDMDPSDLQMGDSFDDIPSDWSTDHDDRSDSDSDSDPGSE